MLTIEHRARLSRAMYEIHRPSAFYAGLTEDGEAWLAAGGSIGPDGMPLGVGMKSWRCCSACHHRPGPPRHEWPCDTVRLLLEAGVLVPVEDLELEVDVVEVRKRTVTRMA